jgi:hypothetical protein
LVGNFRRGTYVDASSKEAPNEETAIEYTVRDVAQMHILSTTSAQVAKGTKHANGAEGDEADDHDLGPWRIVY